MSNSSCKTLDHLQDWASVKVQLLWICQIASRTCHRGSCRGSI